uniref:GntR family transcriptional regulator n=1 Tax=Candidatus Planktophila sp. TaxID=2175601 RepID=UPI0040494424
MKASQGKGSENTGLRYREIEAWLREIILNGRPGEVIPSEVEIAASFEVSRMTARQAVLNLMREGLVDRRRGAGTFIADNPLHRREGVLLSFTEDMKRRGLRPSSELISAKKEIATPSDLKMLNLKDPSTVIVIKRLRLADETPLALERVVLTSKCQKVLDEDLISGSLHDALRKNGIQPTLASGWLKARLATTQEANRLDLPTKSPLLVETRVIEDQFGTPIEHTETAYAANRYVVDIKLNCAPAVIAPYSAAPIEPA